SSVRAALFDRRGEPVSGVSVGQSHAPTTTPDGGVEMDAEALLQRSVHCVEEVLRLAGPRAREVRAVGLCTYWHSILGLGADGRACSPVVLWADTRSVREVGELKERLDVAAVHARTGCV